MQRRKRVGNVLRLQTGEIEHVRYLTDHLADFVAIRNDFQAVAVQTWPILGDIRFVDGNVIRTVRKSRDVIVASHFALQFHLAVEPVAH